MGSHSLLLVSTKSICAHYAIFCSIAVLPPSLHPTPVQIRLDIHSGGWASYLLEDQQAGGKWFVGSATNGLVS